jgi:hypothetical protein
LAECPPDRIWLHDLRAMLEWYEQNLCGVELKDPRDHIVRFSIERFPHAIKLLQKNSTREVNNPGKQALAIKAGNKTNVDFGGYDTERAQTFPWVIPIIQRPTKILELRAQPLVGPEKAGDTLYVKEFHPTGRKYKFKVLVCRRVGAALLVPVTCHPRDSDHYPPHYRQVWPL